MEATTVRGRQFSYSHTIGNAAIFCYPVHMSLDADNNLYVVNRGHDGDWVFGINKITVDEDEIGKFGGDGETDGRFVWPTAIVVDSTRDLPTSPTSGSTAFPSSTPPLNSTARISRRRISCASGAAAAPIRDSLALRRVWPSTPTRTCTSQSRATIGCPSSPATASF